ncbi:DUF1015 domain-containing protein [Ichthyenterobacterium sp. W332]|uniref:DUF1015 domain-containing protein n=1 Tax=Microcosmobacter mediterraneus TaxID=3075607 RepID=A0ABU2YL08_9FLAO|nr:DUF1015 domain-containing protein [Ichthyenterobacterium sp. W332]MDT0558826.1 DUF1015 domain-containing protein [Ichthyenterobacterium sp. W332]
MAKIIPFKAVRPTRSKVGLVASRSYDSYTLDERDSRMSYNPYSFLHIINPGFKYDQKLTGEERYRLVRNRYLEFKEDEVFIQDDKPSFYVYRIEDRFDQVFNGIIAASSALDYEKDIIKKHEDTLEKKEKLFKTYLKTVGFNAEPVLLTYPDNAVIKDIIIETQDAFPEYEFTMTYRDTHYLWKIEDETKIQAIQKEFETINTIYIADGHHRSASSYLMSKDDLANEKKSYNFFMSYLIPESDLRIHEFNRLIKDLNGLTKEEFLIQLDSIFRIENRGELPYHPSKAHHFSMYLDGEFYSLYLRKTIYKFENELEKLDAQVLYKTILKPILGIDDLRNDERIKYIHSRNEAVTLKTEIDSGNFKIGFGMVSATIHQMKAIADAGLKMPPKSTYIEPKLRSGLTIYEY